MERTSAVRTRKKKRRKRNNNQKRFFSVLIQLVLCTVVICTALASYNREKNVQSVLSTQNSSNSSNSQTTGNNETSKEDNNKDDISDNASSIDEKRFEGITLINDNRGVPVICYHSVSKDSSKKGSIIISKDKLREQLQTIKDNGYTTLTMAELNNYLFKNEHIPEKSVVITFDDGYRDNYENAFPILKEFNMKATIFVISSYVNRELYLTGDEIKEMSDYGIDIESHTVSHKRLSTMSYEEQAKELKDSKKAVEDLTHKPVISVAYPEGKYNNDTKKAVVDAGYSMAFTISRGYADRNDNLAELNRICIDYTFKSNSMINVLKNLKK